MEHLQASMYAVQFKPLQPPLLYPWLVFPALMAPPPADPASYERAARFLRTVPILLEAPIFVLQPEADAKSWNQRLLISNRNVIGVTDLVGGEQVERGKGIRDVLFELSPLEFVGWTDLLKKGAQVLVPRAVHLLREDEVRWQLQVYFQNAPKEQISTLFEKPASIRFDCSSERFQIEETNNWKDISTNPIAAKSLFVALAILRDLSPDSKSRALAVLKRAPEMPPSWRYFLLRDPDTNEPYMAE